MKAPFSTFLSANGWWAFNEARTFVFNSTLAEAKATIAEIFGTGFESEFDKPVSAEVYKTTVGSAVQNVLASVSHAMEDREETEANERLRALLKLTFNAASALTEAIEHETAVTERGNDLKEQAIALQKAQEKLAEEQRAEQIAARDAMLKAQLEQKQAAEAEQQAMLDAERARLRKSKKLVRWIDGSSDFVDVSVTPNRVLRKFKKGETIPPEYLEYAA